MVRSREHVEIYEMISHHILNTFLNERSRNSKPMPISGINSEYCLFGDRMADTKKKANSEPNLNVKKSKLKREFEKKPILLNCKYHVV